MRKLILFFFILMFILASTKIAMTQTTLWNQPLSAVNTTPYHTQDYEDWNDDSDIWIADDFDNSQAWDIFNIFVPMDFYLLKDGSTFLNATALHWKIYADANGKPAGDPRGGNPAIWNLSLPPTDSRISLSTGTSGQLSNTTLNLDEPVRIPAGRWWLVFYPELAYDCCGVVGRQPSDATNLSVAQIIQPDGGDNYPTRWTSVLDPSVPWSSQGFPPLAPLQDFAFRLDGNVARSYAVVDPVFYDFGFVRVNQTSPAKTFTITNTAAAGGPNQIISGISIGGTSSGLFNVAPGGTNPCGSLTPTIGAGNSCDIVVTFTPADLESHYASLIINSSSPVADEIRVALSGSGAEAALSVTEGTIGTQFTIHGQDLGTKKGKIYIKNEARKAAVKISKNGWTLTNVDCLVSKALRPALYDVEIVRQPTKTSPPILLKNAFTMRKPSIERLSSISGGAGDSITIFGIFFGTKKGKVYIDYGNKPKSSKVSSWQMTATTGVSTIVFEIPTGIAPGDYSLRVSNKIGEDTIPFTIISK